MARIIATRSGAALALVMSGPSPTNASSCREFWLGVGLSIVLINLSAIIISSSLIWPD